MPEAKVSFNYQDIDFKIVSPTVQMLAAFLKFFCWPWDREIVKLSRVFNFSEMEHVIDVGACIGSHSVLFSLINPEMNIIALEPASINYPYLVRNTRHLPNVKCLKLAASSKVGFGQMAMPTMEQKNWAQTVDPTSNTGIISLYGESDIYREQVNVTTLDKLTDKADFIKIDAEGHDLEVLKGARGLLENERPILMVELMKVNMQMAGTTPQDLDKFFEEIEYKFIIHWRQDFFFAPLENRHDILLRNW